MKDNTINIPGYISQVDYNINWGFPCVSQYNFSSFDGIQISFYNETEEQTEREKDRIYSCAVALWHIKSIH